MKVLFTQLWPEANAGDFGIVLGTRTAIDQAWQRQRGNADSPDVSYTGLTTFARHGDAVAGHFPETLAMGVRLLPALIAGYRDDRCTRYSTAQNIGRSLGFLLQSALLLAGLTSWATRLLPREREEQIEAIRQADLVVIKGGAFLMSFASLQGTLYLVRNALTILWCRRLNRRCVIAPQSFGPFAWHWHQRLLARLIGQDVRVYARETISRDLMQAVGIDARLLPDMAFALPPAPDPAPPSRPARVSSRAGARTGPVALTVRPCPTFKSEAEQESYYAAFEALTRALVQRGRPVEFVAQVTGPDEREDDRVAIRRLLARLPELREAGMVSAVEAPDFESLRRHYAAASLCIGTRMHSVIFSAMSGTPVIAVTYLGPKHAGIMRELGLQDYVHEFDRLDASQILQQLDTIEAVQASGKLSDVVHCMQASIHHEFDDIVRWARPA